MGIFSITIQIANLNGEHYEDVEVMVDTGGGHNGDSQLNFGGIGHQPDQTRDF